MSRSQQMDLVCVSVLQRARAPLSTLWVRDSFNLSWGRREATACRFLGPISPITCWCCCKLCAEWRCNAVVVVACLPLLTHCPKCNLNKSNGCQSGITQIRPPSQITGKVRPWSWAHWHQRHLRLINIQEYREQWPQQSAQSLCRTWLKMFYLETRLSFGQSGRGERSGHHEVSVIHQSWPWSRHKMPITVSITNNQVRKLKSRVLASHQPVIIYPSQVITDSWLTIRLMSDKHSFVTQPADTN